MKQISYAIAFTGSLFLLVSCAGNKEQKPEESTPKYRAGVEAVMNSFSTGNTDGMDSLIDAGYVEHTPPPEMEVKGIDGFKQMVKMNHDAYPDCKITIFDYIENGDIAMVHYNWKGTNTGAFGKWPATNKAIDVNGVDVLKFKDGKCTDHWGYFEEIKFMTQLGAMPPMNQAPAADSAAAKQ